MAACAASTLVVAGSAGAAEILVNSDITTSTTWTANNTYNLQKQIYVKNGATLTIESRRFPGRGRVKFTGQIGKVMNESAEIAVSFARSLEPDEKFWTKNDIHIHVPDGATPKDGPSAGITITTALLSLLRNKKIKSGYAMTGEIRLSGDVLPIGGLREKIVAARRVGIRNVIFPFDNLRDYEELPKELKAGLKVYPTKHYSEIDALLFGSTVQKTVSRRKPRKVNPPQRKSRAA